MSADAARRLAAELDECLLKAQTLSEAPAFRLQFDGALSEGEVRILDQGTLEDRA